MNEKIISIRNIKGAPILNALNCSYISSRFFNRSRAWFIQRLNNNRVNGKPVSFTPEELLLLRASLKSFASDITKFTVNIPNIPNDMSIKVYVIEDSNLIEYLQNDELEDFKEYLNEDETIYIPEPEYFDSETEALAFCSGLGYGVDERGPVKRYPLRSCESVDLPYIEALENY